MSENSEIDLLNNLYYKKYLKYKLKYTLLRQNGGTSHMLDDEIFQNSNTLYPTSDPIPNQNPTSHPTSEPKYWESGRVGSPLPILNITRTRQGEIEKNAAIEDAKLYKKQQDEKYAEWVKKTDAEMYPGLYDTRGFIPEKINK